MFFKSRQIIIVCKPDSHKTLYEWVEDLERNGVVKTVVHKRWTGKRHETDAYRHVSAVPLRDTDDALLVNWCEITTRAEDGKVQSGWAECNEAQHPGHFGNCWASLPQPNLRTVALIPRGHKKHVPTLPDFNGN